MPELAARFEPESAGGVSAEAPGEEGGGWDDKGRRVWPTSCAAHARETDCHSHGEHAGLRATNRRAKAVLAWRPGTITKTGNVRATASGQSGILEMRAIRRPSAVATRPPHPGPGPATDDDLGFSIYTPGGDPKPITPGM